MKEFLESGHKSEQHFIRIAQYQWFGRIKVQFGQLRGDVFMRRFCHNKGLTICRYTPNREGKPGSGYFDAGELSDKFGARAFTNRVR